jgi:hypothetical protein
MYLFLLLFDDQRVSANLQINRPGWKTQAH